MLLRYAKLAGGLRLLIATAAPLVVTSASLLSVRTAAYLVGFGLSSILSIWLPVVVSLVSLTGIFGGAGDSWECQQYRAEMKLIEDTNRAALEAWQVEYDAYINGALKDYLLAYEALNLSATQQSKSSCAGEAVSTSCVVCGGGGVQGISCVSTTCYPQAECESREYNQLMSTLTAPNPPNTPELLTYNGCGSESPPDCPPGKKVWLQVLWASPRGNASDSKGCFIVAYSQDSRDLPPNIEYNPFLPESFVKQQALNYDNITGNKLAGADSTVWEDLDSSAGWDKGYWAAEAVDTECRGWRPGWSLKVK